MKSLGAITFAFALFLFCFGTWAKPISISVVSSIDFGIAVQGDIARTILASTVENAENASFKITGDRNTVYSIVLPISASLIHQTNPSATINISTFTSFPAVNGLLDSRGQDLLLVGGVRQNILWTQLPGTYNGSFAITVVY